MESELSWISSKREYVLENMKSGTYEKVVNLTEEYERCESSDKINIPLREHQKRTVKAMCDLEIKRYIKVDLKPILGSGSISNQIIDAVLETSAGVLSEKPGAGKTLEILSLVAIRGNNVKLVPEISTIDNYFIVPKKKKRGVVFGGFIPDIKRIYKKVIKTTLVFVGRVVMEQWKYSVENYTKLKYMSIENIKDMWYLNDLLCNNPAELSKYDLIIVKNGKISGTFTPDNLKGSHIYDKKIKNILSVFGEICKNICFARVVLDDFDQLGVPSDALTIPSIFTWFVSSTKQMPQKNTTRSIGNTVSEQIFKSRQPYHSAWKNAELFGIFNISASNDFVDFSCRATVIEYLTYVIDVVGDNYIGLMNGLGVAGEQAGHFINAGAIVSGARNLGIKGEHGNLLMEIFGKLIDMQWDEYRLLNKTKKYINKVTEYIATLDRDDSDPSDKTLKQIKSNITKKHNFKKLKDIVKYDTPQISDLISEITDTTEKNIKQSELVVSRVRDSLREGECPIDLEPLADRDIIIRKCCGKVVSAAAFNNWVSTNGGRNVACPLCRKTVTANDYIVVDKSIEHEGFLTDEVYDYSQESSTEDEVEQQLEEEELDDSFLYANPVESARAKQLAEMNQIDKINAVLFIIMGMEDKLQEVYDPTIKNKINGIMHGDNDVPYVGKKFIIYNDTIEFTKAIKPKLLALNIAFEELKGTIKHAANIVKRYKLPPDDAEAINVLIISGPEYCAGSDLQNTDGIIFTHQMRNINTEKQVGGRGARIGRKSNLRIYRILHPNERNAYVSQ